MPTVVATGQMTLLDLNDAFVAGTQPSNPIEGMLWVDTSTTPSKLKIYKLGTWVPQTLSLIDLDPDYGAQKGKIDDLIDDAKLSHTERGDLATILYELIPVLPSTGTALSLAGTSADTAAELFAGATWQTGLVYQIRKAALDVGLLSSHASFVATKTKYNAMVTQLNLMKTASAPIIYGWEVSSTYKATFVPVANADAFRTALKELYQALNALATLTTDFVNDEAIYRASYGNQLVGNAYGGTGTNRNFSSFTFTTAQKVTGTGSFSRTQTAVVFSDELIPVDPSRNYVLRLQIKGSTTAGKQVIGLICYNSAGGSIGERYIVRDDTNSYFLPYTTAWSAYRGRIGGLGGGTDVNSSMFPVGTVSVKIYFSTNLYTTTNTAYFADIEFDVEKIESGVDYNGINLSGTSGITVESLKNTLTMNATKGIEIIKKTDPSNPIFKVDSTTGDLNVKGNINMTGGTISWANVGTPTAAQVGAATPDELTSAVMAVNVGGRNLVLNSTFNDGFRKWNNIASGYTVIPAESDKPFSKIATVTRSGLAAAGYASAYTNKSPAEMGETYTFSFDFKVADFAVFSDMPYVGIFEFYNSTGTRVQYRDLMISDCGYTTLVNNKWYRMVYTVKVTNATVTSVAFRASLFKNGQVFYREVQIERGTKATDWSPAIEDLTSEMDSFKNAAAATGLVTVIDKDTVQTGKVKADYIDVKGLTVNNGTKNTFRVDSAGNVSVDGNINMTGGSISWGSIGAPSPAQVGAATPNDVSAAVSDLAVGGRNLLTNSGMFQNLKGWLNSGSITTKDGYPVIYSAGAGYISTGNLQILEPNTEYVCTMEIMLAANFNASYVVPNHIYAKRVSDNVDVHGGITLIGGNRTLLANKWEKVSVTFKTDNTTAPMYFKFHDYTSNVSVDKWLRWVKLEKGNKPTDWSPAPEDSINEVNALRAAAAASGLVTVIDRDTVQTGKVKADYLDVKGLTVNNGAVDTFKVDAGGNVSVNGTLTVNSASNVYSKSESQLIAKNTNNVGLGMKMNFGTFSAAATNKVYFHGFSYNDTSKAFLAADVDGFFYSYDNTTKVYPTKGVLDVSTGTPLTQGYVIYDTATAKFYFICYDVPTGKWYRYNAADTARHNQVFTFTSTMFIIADLDLAS